MAPDKWVTNTRVSTPDSPSWKNVLMPKWMSAFILPWYLSCCGVGSGRPPAGAGKRMNGGGAERAAAAATASVQRAVPWRDTIVGARRRKLRYETLTGQQRIEEKLGRVNNAMPRAFQISS